MSTSRLLAALAVATPLLVFAVMMLRGPVGEAQIAPVPTPAPLAATPANVIPLLLPAPGIPVSQASATPTARTFMCSCHGPDEGVIWMGRLGAASFFAARQAAVGQCAAYLRSKTTVSAFIPPRSSGFFQATPLAIPTPLASECQGCTCD